MPLTPSAVFFSRLSTKLFVEVVMGDNYHMDVIEDTELPIGVSYKSARGKAHVHAGEYYHVLPVHLH